MYMRVAEGDKVPISFDLRVLNAEDRSDYGREVGRAVATEFVRDGCDVVLLSRDPERLECAAIELEAFGGRALAIPTAADRVDASSG